MTLAILLAACHGPPCGPSADPCEDEAHACLWTGRGPTGTTCVRECSSDADCDGKERCTGTAASCTTCDNVVTYCESALERLAD